MAASVTIAGLDPLLARITGIRGGQLQKDLVDNLHKAASPIRAEMAAATFTPIQRRAMGSVDVNKIGDGIDANGGRGGNLGAVLFAGAEFGGRKSKKVVYMSRSPLGRAYSIRRRTTMQFLPHLGREGYFFWPTMRDWLPKLHKQAVDIASKSLGGR
jgi:hypothetical protein